MGFKKKYLQNYINNIRFLNKINTDIVYRYSNRNVFADLKFFLLFKNNIIYKNLNLYKLEKKINFIDFEFNKKIHIKTYKRYYVTLKQQQINFGFANKINFYTKNFIKTKMNLNLKDTIDLKNNNRLLNVNFLLTLPIQKPLTIITNSYDVIHS